MGRDTAVAQRPRAVLDPALRRAWTWHDARFLVEQLGRSSSWLSGAIEMNRGTLEGELRVSVDHRTADALVDAAAKVGDAGDEAGIMLGK